MTTDGGVPAGTVNYTDGKREGYRYQVNLADLTEEQARVVVEALEKLSENA